MNACINDVVGFDDALNEFGAIFFRICFQISGISYFNDISTHFALEFVRLHVEEIDRPSSSLLRRWESA